MLNIEKRFVDEMVAHTLEEAPNECCGMLSGKDDAVSKLYRIENTQRSPSRYVMDCEQQRSAMRDSRKNGQRILVIYHSHTDGEANCPRNQFASLCI